MPITKTKEERRGEVPIKPAQPAPPTSSRKTDIAPAVDKAITALGIAKLTTNGDGAITGLNRKVAYYVVEATPDTEAQELPQAVRFEDDTHLYIRKAVMLQTVTKVPKITK